MKEIITTTAIAGTTGFLGWLFTKMQTRRERKKGDLQLISEAISPLITSIGQLTTQNNEIMAKLLVEQDKVLQLIGERAKLIQERCQLEEKIDQLQKTVKTLNERLNKFIKDNDNA